MRRSAFISIAIIMICGVAIWAQQKVNVSQITANPNALQVAAMADTVACATDTGCVSPNGDPCENPANTRQPFNINFASTTSQVVVAATSAKKGYICSMIVDTQNAAGDTFILTDGTQMTNPCDAGTPTALLGSTTASQGIFVNPGFVYGNGAHSLWQTSAVNRQICVATVSASRFTANGYYVVQ